MRRLFLSTIISLLFLSCASVSSKLPEFDKLEGAECNIHYLIRKSDSIENVDRIDFEIRKGGKKSILVNDIPVRILKVKPFIRTLDSKVAYFYEHPVNERFLPGVERTLKNLKKPFSVKNMEPLEFRMYLYGLKEEKGLLIHSVGEDKSVNVDGEGWWDGSFNEAKYYFRMGVNDVIVKKEEYKWITDSMGGKPDDYALALSPANGFPDPTNVETIPEAKREPYQPKTDEVVITHSSGIWFVYDVLLAENPDASLTSKRKIMALPVQKERDSYILKIKDDKLIGKQAVVDLLLEDNKARKQIQLDLNPKSRISLDGKE